MRKPHIVAWGDLSKIAIDTTCNNTECEGFTGTSGAVKPRSSVDVDELRSSKSMDDELQAAPAVLG